MDELSFKKYEILIIESDSNCIDEIVNKFEDSDLSVTIAEVKTLLRAEPLINSENINFIIFGPSLLKEKILEFNIQHKLKETHPTLYLKLEHEYLEEIEFLDAGISNIIKYPFDSNTLKEQLEVTTLNYQRNKNLKKQEKISPKKSTTTLQVGEAQQLGLILDKLSTRLSKISNQLRKLPISTKISDSSLPEAVNKVITGATQIRLDKEEEDINSLIDSIIKK
jgi:DNA-binding response OmpR family regulator